MSFITYIINCIYKKIRKERVETQLSCNFFIFEKEKEGIDIDPSKLKEAVIINYSIEGFGIITTPSYATTQVEGFVKNKNKIYIEYISPDTNTMNKLIGAIRWAKSVTNIAKPYSEIGILLSSVDEESKKDVLNALFEK